MQGMSPALTESWSQTNGRHGVSMVTSTMLGAFRQGSDTRREFLSFIDVGPGR